MEPCPSPSCLRCLIPCSTYSHELCCHSAADTGLWPGDREDKEEVSLMQREVISLRCQEYRPTRSPQMSCKAASCSAWDPTTHGVPHYEDGQTCLHQV